MILSDKSLGIAGGNKFGLGLTISIMGSSTMRASGLGQGE
jgi:hypothetical protein